jgi:hypothetical protein
MDLGIVIGLGINAAGVIASLLASLRNGRKIQEVHLTMNSRLDQLLDSTRKQGFSDGAEHARATDSIATADAAAKVLATAAAAAADAAKAPAAPVP